MDAFKEGTNDSGGEGDGVHVFLYGDFEHRPTRKVRKAGRMTTWGSMLAASPGIDPFFEGGVGNDWIPEGILFYPPQGFLYLQGCKVCRLLYVIKV